jgi:hypothetical protein
MSKRYECRIIERTTSDPLSMHLVSIDTIESDNLIHLLTQISFILLRLQKKDLESLKDDDEIPF